MLASMNAGVPVLELFGVLDRLATQAMMDAARVYAGGPNRPGAPGGVSASKEGIVQRRFTKTNTHGFKPLSSRYARWKQQKFGNKPILVATGRLRESLHRATFRAEGNSVVIRFRVPDYGRWHHDGSGNLPKRSPVEPNEQDRVLVRRAAARSFEVLVKVQAQRLGVTVR